MEKVSQIPLFAAYLNFVVLLRLQEMRGKHNHYIRHNRRIDNLLWSNQWLDYNTLDWLLMESE